MVPMENPLPDGAVLPASQSLPMALFLYPTTRAIAYGASATAQSKQDKYGVAGAAHEMPDATSADIGECRWPRGRSGVSADDSRENSRPGGNSICSGCYEPPRSLHGCGA